MPDRHASRLLWLAFATAFVLLAWQFQDSLEMLFSARGKLTVKEQSNRVVLSWRGDIKAPLASKLEEAYRAHASNTRRFLIALHSPGGTLDHGRDVIRLIRRMQQTLIAAVIGLSSRDNRLSIYFVHARETNARRKGRFVRKCGCCQTVDG